MTALSRLLDHVQTGAPAYPSPAPVIEADDDDNNTTTIAGHLSTQPALIAPELSFLCSTYPRQQVFHPRH